MQSGITYGYVSLVDGIVSKMKEEVKMNPYVIATGGLANLIYKESNTIDEVDEFLTLKGLKILYNKNKDTHKFK
jgi:type III pantothenate kinase